MCLLKCGSRVTDSWRLTKMLHTSTLGFHAGNAGDKSLWPIFLPSHRTGAVYHDLLPETSFQIRCKAWMCRLGSICGSFMMVLDRIFYLAIREFLNNKFPEQWIERDVPTAWPARSPNLIPHIFAYEDIYSLLFTVKESVTCWNRSNEAKWIWHDSLGHLEFYSYAITVQMCDILRWGRRPAF